MFERIAGRTRPAAAVLVVGALMLSGCTVPQDPPSSTSAAPTDSVIFATDEEALAAATEAYAAYLAMSDESTSSQENADAFLGLSVGDARELDVEGEQMFRDRKWQKIGRSSFDSMRVQDIQVVEGSTEVTTYLCLDVSATDVLDEHSQSVVSSDRPERLPLVVRFVTVSNAPSDLLISGSDVWSGQNFC